MAIALVASVGAAGTANGVTTGSIDTTGANLLVVVWCDNAGSAATVSDSKSNTWTLLTAQTGAGSRTRIAYVLSPTVGSGHTFTASGTGSVPSIAALAFSGVKTSAAFDVQNGAVAAGAVTSLATGSITPSEDNEVLIFGLGGARVNTASVDVGTITHQNILVGGTCYSIAGAYQIQTTATARNPLWSWTPTGAPSQAVIASFEAAAASGILRQMMNYEGA